MKKSGLNLILLSLLFVSCLMFVSAAVLDNTASGFVLTISDFLNIGTMWKEIIIGLIVLMIIIAGVYDILELTSIFQQGWVKVTISIGLGLIAALTNMVYNLSVWLIKVAAGAGVIGVALEIILAIFVFIMLSFGGTWAAKWAAKRKGQAEEVAAIRASGQTSSAIQGLREIQKEFRQKR